MEFNSFNNMVQQKRHIGYCFEAENLKKMVFGNFRKLGNLITFLVQGNGKAKQFW